MRTGRRRQRVRWAGWRPVCWVHGAPPPPRLRIATRATREGRTYGHTGAAAGHRVPTVRSTVRRTTRTLRKQAGAAAGSSPADRGPARLTTARKGRCLLRSSDWTDCYPGFRTRGLTNVRTNFQVLAPARRSPGWCWSRTGTPFWPRRLWIGPSIPEVVDSIPPWQKSITNNQTSFL